MWEGARLSKKIGSALARIPVHEHMRRSYKVHRAEVGHQSGFLFEPFRFGFQSFRPALGFGGGLQRKMEPKDYLELVLKW